MSKSTICAKLLRLAVLPAMLAGCKSLPPEPPPVLTPQYQLSSVLLVEELKSPGFGDYPNKLDAALVEAFKSCSIDVHSHVSRDSGTLSLSTTDDNLEAVKAKIREFHPKTLVAIESPNQQVSTGFITGGTVQSAHIKIVVKDLQTNAIIRTTDLGMLGHDLSDTFGSRRGSLRWQILHNLHRDGLLACDPGPTDGNWWDNGK